MKNRIVKRKAPRSSFQHIYKITADRGTLFYRTLDHLVYYTIESVMSRRYNVRVLAACHMYNHTHKLSAPRDLQQMISCESNINIAFTREYNRECGRRGRLFQGPFGSAAKYTDKDKRSALIYVMNNPVEKKLCTRAVDDRWTFLAYYEQDYPFSERPVLSRCRWALRDAMKMVEHEFHCGRYMRYALLHQLFAGLGQLEREQLTDYILQLYFFFDREGCLELFGSWDKMVEATDYSKGKEFDVGEVYEPFSDVPIREMCRIADHYKLLGPGLSLLHLPENRKRHLAEMFRAQANADDVQIGRFFHQYP